MKVMGVIPARYHSTRLEGKPLADIGGRPMIQWVYENAKRADILDEVVVATDDTRIFEVVQHFGGRAVMTSKDHSTGTDRIAEVVAPLEVQVVVNIQGDEPFVSPTMITEVANALMEDGDLPMATIMHEIAPEKYHNPNVVKVATDMSGFALYFSRSLIPFPRHGEGSRVFGHIGIYGYRKGFLLRLTRMTPTPLERAESLEQLRVIENGFRIKVIETTAKDYTLLSVDTKEDLERARRHVAAG